MKKWETGHMGWKILSENLCGANFMWLKKVLMENSCGDKMFRKKSRSDVLCFRAVLGNILESTCKNIFE